MAYIINKTDGTILTTLIDGTLDNTTDLTLIGKNYSGFGEAFNENLVKLLENFSSQTSPARPIVGQLWYDTLEARLKIYTETGWKASGGAIVSAQTPLNFTTGDFWIDNLENQLYFFDGSDLVLAGPIWKRSQGKTGFTSDILVDLNGNSYSVLYLWVGNSLMGIFAADQFTPDPAIPGFTTLIKGFNANTQIGSVFGTTAANSLTLNNLSSTRFMRSDVLAVNSERIWIQNNNGLTVGANNNANIKISGNLLLIENVVNAGSIAFSTRLDNNPTIGLYLDAGTNRVGILTSSPQEALDVAGNLRVRGNFIVEGDTVTMSVSDLSVEDRNIVLAVPTDSSPSNASADNGGIIIKGTTDKTILYKQASNSFEVSETITIPEGKTFNIGANFVLSGNTLGPAITSAPGITSIGPQVELVVDDLYFNNNSISTRGENQDLRIEPNGTGNIALVNRPRITGLRDPVEYDDAATKQFTEILSKITPLSLTFIDNGLTSAINSKIILLLNDIANPFKFLPTKEAYVHVQHIDEGPPLTVTRYLKKFKIDNNFNWSFDGDLTNNVV